VLALFRDLLEVEGYRVTLAPDALDLAAVKRVGPDLVILDRMLEEGAGSGWHLLDDLRRDPATAALPVVVCTGAVHRVRENAALLDQFGASLVLKPFDIDRLLRTIGDALAPTDGDHRAAPAPAPLDPAVLSG
jgi:CheY-like chemotaxis protein